MIRSIVWLLREILLEVQANQLKSDNIIRLLKNPDSPLAPTSYKNQVDPLSNRSVVWEERTLEDGIPVRVRRSGNDLPPKI